MSGAADSNNRVPQSVDTIKQMFQDTGILEYEPQLPAQVCDIAHALTKQVLAETRSVSEFSGKKQVDITDVEFALKALNEKHIALRPPKSFMTELAMEKNAHPLPPIRQNYGLRLPNDRFCQLQQNYEYVGTQSSSRSDGERENKTSQVNKEGQRKFIASAPTNVDNFNPELVSNILMGRPKHSIAIATDGSRKRPYLEENNSDQRADVEDDYDYD